VILCGASLFWLRAYKTAIDVTPHPQQVDAGNSCSSDITPAASQVRMGGQLWTVHATMCPVSHAHVDGALTSCMPLYLQGQASAPGSSTIQTSNTSGIKRGQRSPVTSGTSGREKKVCARLTACQWIMLMPDCSIRHRCSFIALSLASCCANPPVLHAAADRRPACRERLWVSIVAPHPLSYSVFLKHPEPTVT
jgi:hypothetical protein